MSSAFPCLASLDAGANQFVRLPPTSLWSLGASLTTLNLEYNDFTALSQLSSLATLEALQSLCLKGNNISATTADNDALPVFHVSLCHVDLSYNRVAAWTFVDALATIFPGLTGLRISHNPIYDDNDPSGAANLNVLADEAFMITLGRLGCLTTLNQSPVTASDRSNADMFYLSHIAKQLSSTAEAAESDIIAQHPRFHELCATYGAPDVVRQAQTNPNFLESRLVNVTFRFKHTDPLADGPYPEKKVAIPKSFDVYAVRAATARLFDIDPMRTKLVWETGEWDPVGGFVGFVSSAESLDHPANNSVSQGGEPTNTTEAAEPTSEHGKWVRREVELREGPRQLGFCVDRMEAKIRVELLEPDSDIDGRAVQWLSA